MKLRNQLTLTASLMLAAGAAWGHPGHEAIGDVLHIEYLVAGAAAVATAVYAKVRLKRDKDD
ncbi:hypothetical protein [Marinobacter similis]|uniref:Uncharacterized protein n=1 Tax=Marinobacter similis TaxID=1420916 RepID=W5YGM1_9GAMM|nr:hypothetical protein [Marinobacter similis]AHI28226.1 hypothetical protein AU14_05165 [Marinobacter similis]